MLGLGLGTVSLGVSIFSYLLENDIVLFIQLHF